MNWHPSRELPYSENPKELIVCKNTNQIKQVQAAFKWDAQYITWAAAICGCRYNRIIVFKSSHFDSQAEKEAFEREFHETYQTRLYPKGEIIVIDC